MSGTRKFQAIGSSDADQEPPHKKAKASKGGSENLVKNRNEDSYLAQSQAAYADYARHLDEILQENCTDRHDIFYFHILPILHRIAKLVQTSRKAMPISAMDKESVIRLADKGHGSGWFEESEELMSEHDDLKDLFGISEEEWSSLRCAVIFLDELADITESIAEMSYSLDMEKTCNKLGLLVVSVATIFYGLEEYPYLV
ncbi:unnamed protein product [Penicillium pancosmium]